MEFRYKRYRVVVKSNRPSLGGMAPVYEFTFNNYRSRNKIHFGLGSALKSERKMVSIYGRANVVLQFLDEDGQWEDMR